MRVYLSVDLEGISGVVAPDEMNDRARGLEYQMAQRLMTLDANAVIDAAFEVGAREVLVNDSHGSKRNLLPDLLDQRASLLRGAIKQQNMMAGLDRDFDAAVLVGYHGMAGRDRCGILNHTFRGTALVQEVRIDGVATGEIGISAAIASHYGVPIVHVTGDDAACSEARTVLDEVRTTAVKRGIDRLTAVCLAPATARRLIYEDAKAALASRPDPPAQFAASVVVTVRWGSTTAAHIVSWLPNVQTVSATQTEFVASDIVEAMGQLQVMLHAAAAVTL
jgi:D-amino peptidase